MRKHEVRNALATATAFVLAVSVAGCCLSDDDDASHSLSLLGGALPGSGEDEPEVPLGGATGFRILAGSTVTNTGPTSVDGDLGVSPGTAVTGFFSVDGGPGTVSGAIHSGDAAAATAQTNLTTAFNNAAGRPPGTAVSGNLGGRTLGPGVFTASSSLEISSGDLTLTAVGDADAVFIFQIPSTLTVTTGRQVILAGGAQAANVFWQVGSSATLGTNSVFSGTIMAQESITLQTGASLQGRALARTGAVTLESNVVSP